MWRLKCADYDKAAGDDLDLLVDLNVINEDEKALLADLVEDYHGNGGVITGTRQDALPGPLCDRLHKCYKDGLMDSGNDMGHVRAELYHGVGTCPYCGISAPETLDHFMHKNVWKSLSLCRLNLVPACWACNGRKGTKDSRLFLHPYYAGFPDGVFLTAECRIEGTGYMFEFDFDPAVVTDAALLARLRSQWKELDLDRRLRGAVTGFICSAVINKSGDKEALKAVLPSILARIEETNGKNHWRAAVARGCIAGINGRDGDRFFTVLTDPANAARDIPV